MELLQSPVGATDDDGVRKGRMPDDIVHAAPEKSAVELTPLRDIPDDESVIVPATRKICTIW